LRCIWIYQRSHNDKRRRENNEQVEIESTKTRLGPSPPPHPVYIPTKPQGSFFPNPKLIIINYTTNVPRTQTDDEKFKLEKPRMGMGMKKN